MKYAIQRFFGKKEITRLDDLDLEVVRGIVLLVWGEELDTLWAEDGGSVGEEWKLHVGGPHWVIVTRIV